MTSLIRLFKPLARQLIERAGTMAAAYFIARGVDSEFAAQLANFMVAALCVMVDLIMSSVNREREVSERVDAIIASEAQLWPFRRGER